MHVIDIVMRIAWIAVIYYSAAVSSIILAAMKEDRDFARMPYVIFMLCLSSFGAIAGISTAVFT